MRYNIYRQICSNVETWFTMIEGSVGRGGGLREMSKDDLRRKLVELEDDLEELEEVNMFMLRSTGHHIRGVVRKKYERKIANLKEQIRELKRFLQED